MKKFLTVVLLILIVCLCFFAVKEITQKVSLDGYSAVNLYFTNSAKNDFVVEERHIKDNDNKNEYIKSVLDALFNGPTNSSLKSIINEDTNILNVDFKDSTAIINLSSQYLSDDGTDDILARYSIAKTLFDLDDIDSIEILIEGNELKNSSGKSVGKIHKSNVLTSADLLKNENVMLKLYFSDDAAMYLNSETRKAEIIENSIEKTIVAELIKGPKSNDMYAVIPEGAKLISAETKEGICFLNFSEEFVSHHSGGSAGEAMTVYSIVNSLTEINGIEKVQFLVEGNKLDVYKHLEFSEPFSRDESWIN